jgi:hypothetical protein
VVNAAGTGPCPVMRFLRTVSNLRLLLAVSLREAFITVYKNCVRLYVWDEEIFKKFLTKHNPRNIKLN